MRYCKSFPVRALLLVVAVLVCASQFPSAAWGAQPEWNGKPVIGQARIAPLDRLQRDFAFLAEGVAGASTTKIQELFTDLSEGIDASRPAGAVLVLDTTVVPMIFLPVKDEERLLTVLDSRFGWAFEREAEGFYRSVDADGVSRLAARVVGPWVYVTRASHREMLRAVPVDPTSLFAGIDPTLTAHAALHVDRLPPGLRSELIGSLREAAIDSERDSVLLEGNTFVERVAQQLFMQARSIEFELQCFRPLEQFHVTSRLTAIEGSTLERWIDDASQRTTRFSHLPSRDSIFALIASWELDAASVRSLREVWEPVAAQIRAAAPSLRSRDDTERLLGQLAAQAVDSVSTTLQSGQLEGGFVVEKQGRSQVTLLAGVTLQGARALEQTATELGNLLQQSAAFRAMEWSMGGNGDVSMHQLTVPASDESSLMLFGDPIRLAVGVGTEKVYAAMGGEEALTRLSDAVDRSRDEAPQRGEVLRISARLAPLLAALDAVPSTNAESDQNVQAFAERIAPYKKNDTLELSLAAEERALEGRLRVDLGVVRMLASQLPTGHSSSSPPDGIAVTGTLQLHPGDHFQLEFRTSSEITTTIDGNDRLDRGVHSLTYDFQVRQVAADGTMQIETSLSRATIDKTSPEGRELFDSKNPPAPDQMTAEMMLHGIAVGKPFTLTVRPDGTIASISGIAAAIENILDTDLQPAAAEREQARAFVAQLLNEAGLRDSLTRGFEFYPGRQVSAGDRWTRTSANLTLINFLLDNRYQVKALSGDEVVISVRSQVRQSDVADVADQPVRWEVVGSQAGAIMLEPHSGRLRLAEYTLRLDAEATFEMDGNTVARPMVSLFKMTVGDPKQVARKVAEDASTGTSRPTD